MKTVSFTWVGTLPRTTAQQRRHGRGHTYRTPKHKLAVATWHAVCEMYKPAAPLTGALRLKLSFFFHSDTVVQPIPKLTRPDCSNIAKDLEDALMHCGYFADDSQVYRLEVEKYFAPFEAVRVELVQDTPAKSRNTPALPSLSQDSGND